MRHRLAPLFLVLAIVPAASGQVNAAAAEALFREGQDAMKAGRFADACPKFAESNRLDPQLGTLLNLATCHEKQGKVATAWSEYAALSDLATKAGDTGRAEFSKKRATALEPLPTLTLKPAAGVTLKTIKIDEQTFGTTVLGTVIPIDPGPHTLTLATESKQWKQSIVANATGSTSVDVTVPSDGVETPKVAPPANSARETTKSSPLRPVGISLMGAGLGGIALGSIFGALAIGDKSTIDKGCPSAPVCDAQTAVDLSHDANTKALVSTIGFIAGGVLLATGVTLFFVGKPKATTSARIVPSSSGVTVVF